MSNDFKLSLATEVNSTIVRKDFQQDRVILYPQNSNLDSGTNVNLPSRTCIFANLSVEDQAIVEEQNSFWAAKYVELYTKPQEVDVKNSQTIALDIARPMGLPR